MLKAVFFNYFSRKKNQLVTMKTWSKFTRYVFGSTEDDILKITSRGMKLSVMLICGSIVCAISGKFFAMAMNAVVTLFFTFLSKYNEFTTEYKKLSYRKTVLSAHGDEYAYSSDVDYPFFRAIRFALTTFSPCGESCSDEIEYLFGWNFYPLLFFVVVISTIFFFAFPILTGKANQYRQNLLLTHREKEE